MNVLKLKSCSIYFEDDRFTNLNAYLSNSQYTSITIICDTLTYKHCLPLVLKRIKNLSKAHIIKLPNGEKSKSIDVVQNIFAQLIKTQQSKKMLIINLGGGTVCDIGGFAASVYKRGVDYINIPTTLLAMVDAAIGGKTGVNFLGLKNIIGTIYQPKCIIINTNFLNTLPQLEIYSGLAEMYKTQIIGFKKMQPINLTNKTLFQQSVYNTVKFKVGIVLKDEFEQHERKILNFGHTIGHAIEGYYSQINTQILHGEAVVIGMICATWLSYHRQLLSHNDFEKIISTIKNNFKLTLVSKQYFSALYLLMQNDKKNSFKLPSFILLKAIGLPIIQVEVSKMEIIKSLTYYNSLCK